MPSLRRTFLAVAGVLAAACQTRGEAPPPAGLAAPPTARPATDAARVEGAAPSNASPSPAALALPDEPADAGAANFGSDRMVALPVPGFGAAVVAVPIGRKTPAPVVVAGHGNYDRPEWQCEVWGELLRARAIVLCPRGVARSDSPSREDVRFTFPSHARYLAEVDAGLTALRQRFAGAIDGGPMIIVGFSLGAIFGTTLLMRSAPPALRSVLVEGGHDHWSDANARAFRSRGGERVLFACGQSSCVRDAERAAATLRRHKIAVQISRGAGEGHSYGGAVADAVRASLPWLLEGDPRFDVASR